MNNKNGNIVILTGAGISADSGIATFRASDGLWENHYVEDVATPEGFARNPQLVQRFYDERRAQLLSEKISPNEAHYALTKLQKQYAGTVTLITQNVDDLHTRSGSRNVIYMHGELLKVRCVKSGKAILWRKAVTKNDCCNCCSIPQVLRPHIVWFGEMPFYMDKIYQAIENADLFVAIGTSGHVYPAAGFVSDAQANGIKTIEINLEPSKNGKVFDQSIYGRAVNTVPLWVSQILAEK